ERAATQPCRELCGESLKEIGLVCIDDIFAPTNAVAPQAIFAPTNANASPQTYSPDPIPCDVQAATFLNDFASACENADATPPSCQPPPFPDLKMWQDKCGGVHIPFVWKGILATSGRRLVSGLSGVGRKKPPKDPRIWVPGREFL